MLPVMPSNRRKDERRSDQSTISAERRETARRQAERRFDTRCTVDLWLQEELGNEMTFRRAGNLSPGGVYLDLGFSRPPGTRLKLRFTLPQGWQIEVRGEIVPAEQDDDLGTHIRFIDLRPEDHIRISGYMEEEMTEPDTLYGVRHHDDES